MGRYQWTPNGLVDTLAPEIGRLAVQWSELGLGGAPYPKASPRAAATRLGGGGAHQTGCLPDPSPAAALARGNRSRLTADPVGHGVG